MRDFSPIGILQRELENSTFDLKSMQSTIAGFEERMADCRQQVEKFELRITALTAAIELLKAE